MQHSMKQFIAIKQQMRITVPCMEYYGHAEIVYAFSIPMDREESKCKGITMVQ